jgi:hypothetical protein
LRLPARAVLTSAMVVGATGSLFHRAFAPADLVPAVALAVVLGAVIGSMASLRSWPVPLAFAATALALALAQVSLTGRAPTPGAVPDAFVLFLTVGLPAGGLDDLALVPFTVLVSAMATSAGAAARGRTMLALAGPVVAVAVTALLVAPVGFAPWSPAVFVVAAAAALAPAGRDEAGPRPLLLGSTTERHRRRVLWGAVVVVVPAVVASLGLGLVTPRSDTLDLRAFVSIDAEEVAEPNPLATVAVWQRSAVDAASDVARITVEGPSPGRMRVAVLDRYTETGWRQSATFSVTAETLARDPLYLDGVATGGTITTVTVTPMDVDTGLRAVPTTGIPVTVGRPHGVRFSPAAGILIASRPEDPTTYRSARRGPAAGTATTAEPPVGQFPTELAACPASPTVTAVAAELSRGTASPLERLDRIENFLKLRRVHDPAAPGGQTLGAVEHFVGQDFARGNLEVFVTSYALLARCSGVPVRVVVGYPSPPPGESQLRRQQLTAWVETPLALTGWVARDPLATPEEQRQQARLAELALPPRERAELADEEPAPRQVEAHPLALAGRSWPWSTVPAVAAVAAIAAALCWVAVVPAVVLRRRSRTAEPTAAVHAAWATVTDAMIDRRIELAGHHTPTEVVRVAAGTVSEPVTRLLAGLVPIVDRARYSGRPAAAGAAGLPCPHPDAILEDLRATPVSRLAPFHDPARSARRLRSTIGVGLRRHRWRGDLPPAALVATERPRPRSRARSHRALLVGPGHGPGPGRR